jgi:Tol biopolymer transport system component
MAWLSPDERRLAVSIMDERARRSGVWTIDLASGAKTRVTFGADRWSPIWSRDGSKLYYLGEESGAVELLSKTLASGDETVVARNLSSSVDLFDCSTDYCVVGAWRPEAGTNYDVLAVRLSDGVTIASAATEADENYGRLSPDGTLLAYEYQQSGEGNVFVRTFPSGTGIWQVSTGGGKSPVWSRDGKQLYYLTDRDLVATAISTSAGFSAGPPRAIIPRTLAAPDNAVKFDFAQVTPDGRVLAAVRRTTGAGAPYRLVLNWNR